MVVKIPTLRELADARKELLNQKINKNRPINEFAIIQERERVDLENPGAIHIDQNQLRSVNSFYANKTMVESQKNNADSGIAFTKLFEKYGDIEYRTEIVNELEKLLSKPEKKYLINNSGKLHREIDKNLGADTSIKFFVKFVTAFAKSGKSNFENSKKNVNINELPEAKELAKLKKEADDSIAESKRLTNAKNEPADPNAGQIAFLEDSLRTSLDNVRKIAKFKNVQINYDGKSINFNPSEGIGPKSKANKNINKLVNDLKVLDRFYADVTIGNLVNEFQVIDGSGFSKRMKKGKRRISNLKLITGGGKVQVKNETKANKHKKFNDNKSYYEMNKFIIDADILNDNDVIDMRYKLNGKKYKRIQCPSDSIKKMLIQLSTDSTFNINEYMNLKETERKFLLKFCEQCHVNIGLNTSVQDYETQYKIYLGEKQAGNPLPLLNFLFNSFSRGNLTKKDYLESLEEILKSK